jgi:UDP-N-acetylmuramoyl-tripeptide--D-alanyl-D-alanine ligase
MKMPLYLHEFKGIPTGSFDFRGSKEESNRQLSGISIDSRTIGYDELYVALRGANHDGHDFVASALEKGAAAAMVEESWWLASAASIAARNVIVVKDSLKALQDLAHYYRKRFDIPVIAVTGTNGKTTTKEMIAAVLSKKWEVCKTEGNLNNHIGVPLTLLRLRHRHRALVLEQGMNHFGEIAALCEISDPTDGLITNIGRGHVEHLGGIEGVARAKAELFDYIAPDKHAFVNIDDQWIVSYTGKLRHKTTFGFTKNADIAGEQLPSDDNGFSALRVEGVEIRLTVAGRHNLTNALAAVAVGKKFGVALDDIKDALENLILPGKRMELMRKNGILILNDCYNANPDSMLAAVETLAWLAIPGKKIAVLGDMLELGQAAQEEHASIGEAIANLPVDLVLTVGEYSQKIVERSEKSQNRHFSEKKDLIEVLREAAQPGDAVLVKGSRGMRMEDIIREVF